MPEIFLCWDPDNGDESCSRSIEAYDEECAADEYLKQTWASHDYPDSGKVCVKCDNSGKITTFRYEVEMQPHFDLCEIE